MKIREMMEGKLKFGKTIYIRTLLDKIINYHNNEDYDNMAKEVKELSKVLSKEGYK